MEPQVEVVKQKRKYTKKGKPHEEIKQDVVIAKKEKKEKKKRVIDPSKMTYIKAFSMWKQRQDPQYVGLSPKRFTKEYDEIMKILKGGE